ncbi:MAG: hypothetical protein CL916_11905 [Deltaproteobacteria bacterium]|nr:hypothetical protein [Deltaproteobacteria bacterium]
MTVSQFSQHTSCFVYLFKEDIDKTVFVHLNDFHPTQKRPMTLLCVYNQATSLMKGVRYVECNSNV